MVYRLEHLLIRFNGHFGTALAFSDKWSCGIRFGNTSAIIPLDTVKLQTFVNACQTAGIAFQTAANTNIGSNCFLDYVTGAQIGVNGKYDPATQVTITSPIQTTAGLGTPSLPWNTASVLSLRTAIPRGRASNGRVYWPHLAGSVIATTGRVNIIGRVTAAKTFFDALNTAANAYSPGMRAIVASNVGTGLTATVTSIRSDDRLDSIERRENDQPVAWSSAALA